jgi:hypothetical protein
MVKNGNIIKNIGTKEVYEVISVVGTMLMCKPVNQPDIGILVPMRIVDVEVMIEDETEAFNILFRKND